MNTISKETTYTYTIKKSLFIGILLPIKNQKDVNEKLEYYKKKYSNATHYCYAFRLPNLEKYSDDKEPSKTAGLPILQILQMKNLIYTLCIIIRYFGGIKLGASHLTRTYRKVASDTINQAVFVPYVEKKQIKIQFPYEEETAILYHLNASWIKEKEYQEQITYTIEASTKEIKDFKEKFESTTTISFF